MLLSEDVASIISEGINDKFSLTKWEEIGIDYIDMIISCKLDKTNDSKTSLK